MMGVLVTGVSCDSLTRIADSQLYVLYTMRMVLDSNTAWNPIPFSRHGVIAAGVERVAPGYPPGPQPAPFEEAVFVDCLAGVPGAGGHITAGGGIT